ncbi:hypothetical protein [Longibaculum muris]|uniref:hypothetical protein n=1 Tax=Longibaculum muris TaxID=1796628 RepID=UPI0022E458FF|nr:hypothetical protein [Longibaculum muris]
MESKRGNYLGYLKFFLQCVIDQCSNFIYKIHKIKNIYYQDMEKIKLIKGNLVCRLMPIPMT